MDQSKAVTPAEHLKVILYCCGISNVVTTCTKTHKPSSAADLHKEGAGFECQPGTAAILIDFFCFRHS